MVIRNRLAVARAGGPRQFSEMRDKLLVKVDSQQGQRDLLSELDRVDMKGKRLSNEDVVIASPETQINQVLERLRKVETDDLAIRQAIDELDPEEDIVEASTSVLRATETLLSFVNNLQMVSIADFAFTYADYGPENLRVSPTEMEEFTDDDVVNEDRNLNDLNKKLNLSQAWEKHNRGGNSIVAIFDTGFADDLIDESRIAGTFHGEDVDSVYESSEGHGTMCAGAAVANRDEGVPMNGIAPDAGVILVRITDSEGQIRQDIIAEGWDWLVDFAESEERPIVTNHSYGTPLCSGRPRNKFCNGPSIDLLKTANSTSNIVSSYAAGNEAGHCGRRPSGVTNAITGGNSISEVITVGAARYDMREIQRYSSHGRGDCAPIADPKPNVCFALPHKIYYGGEEGYTIKNASQGIGGSTGGTSHASPSTAGAMALIQSKSMEVNGEPLQTEEIKKILHDTADQIRTTHINAFGLIAGEEGYDARFGRGHVNIMDALEAV